MSTETRSRDEWLAEVKRRGERIRRRRRLSVTLVGVLALVLPASALAGFLTAPRDNAQQLSVAGPAVPAGAVAGDIGAGPAVLTQPAREAEPATTTTTIEAIIRQGPTAGAFVAPTSPASVPPSDNPVVARATTTTVVDGTSQSSSQSGPQTLVVPPTTIPAKPCTMADVTVSISTEKKEYRTGEIVRASAELLRRDGATCRVPLYSDFQILNSAGKDVLAAGLAQETRMGYSTGEDGGRAFVDGSITWEALDCTAQRLSPIVPAPDSRVGCIAFPAGTYTVVAPWTDSSLATRTTFELTV